MRRLARFLDHISRGLVYVAAGALTLLFIFVCLSAFMRYFVGKPFAFTEELVALLFLMTVFLTLPFATSRNMHINVTFAADYLKGGWRKAMSIFNLVVMLVFVVWFTLLSFDFTALAYRIGALSEQVGFRLWPWMGMIPLAAVTMLAIVFVQLVRAFGNDVDTEKDEGHSA